MDITIEVQTEFLENVIIPLFLNKFENDGVKASWMDFNKLKYGEKFNYLINSYQYSFGTLDDVNHKINELKGKIYITFITLLLIRFLQSRKGSN